MMRSYTNCIGIATAKELEVDIAKVCLQDHSQNSLVKNCDVIGKILKLGTKA